MSDSTTCHVCGHEYHDQACDYGTGNECRCPYREATYQPEKAALDRVQELLNDRRATYGDRIVNMEAVAKMINGYLDGVELRTGSRTITGADFAMIMALYKIYRFAVTPDYADNSNDAIGYIKIAIECIGEAMIEAETAAEFQRKKTDRDLSNG